MQAENYDSLDAYVQEYYLDTPVTGDEALEKLKQSIKGSKFWFFWWD